MNKRKKIFWTAAALTLGLSAVCSGAVGSDDDPLISLSYITNVVMPYIDEAVSNTGTAEFEVVEVPTGKSITAGGGAELILRSGKGVVSLDKSASGGFTDVTDGKDITSGEIAEANHHLICPRSDGRSIKAESKLYIMVKGAYEIG